MTISTKSDIRNSKDIQLLVDTFYEKVKQDSVISHFFMEVMDIDWDEHMPIMYRFWESVLLDNPVYKGNPIARHFEVHARSPMEHHHFVRWLYLFHETVDELFSGQLADTAKFRADGIARLMEHKIIGYQLRNRDIKK